MIEFRPLMFKDRLLEFIFPGLRRDRERRVDEAMRVLMADSEKPCVIDGWLIPDGKGSPQVQVRGK